MKHLIFGAMLGILAVPAHASTIKNACLSAERRGDYGLCACIQAAADRTLSKRDQRLAASFFRDPDRAQEIRRSDRPAHEVFWDRYRAFGEMAEAFCS